MKYTALYRKYRPIQFEDVCGQEHIVSALSNQLKSDRIAHAYLFCGTRGTGKTTMAKIFAAAVNCENQEDKPCCNCQSCKSFIDGRAINIIEMDAASNNGVDDVRNIVEEVAYPPVDGKYKVYIIDEVHMLSVNAFNALLKTLEEPPEYVIFILATTEPNKLPATILSRCQKYEFRQISSEVIYQRLKVIANKEELSIEDAALEYIARAGEGSMRDALSVMDRCVAFGIGQTITLPMITSLLGTADYMMFGRMLRAIKEHKVIEVLKLIKEFAMRGLDYYRLTADFLWYLRNIMILKVDSSLTDIINVSADAAKQMQEVAEIIEIADIIEYIETLSTLYNRLKYSAVRRIDMEITLISMCKLAPKPVSKMEEQESKGEKLIDKETESKKDRAVQAEKNEFLLETGNLEINAKKEDKEERTPREERESVSDSQIKEQEEKELTVIGQTAETKGAIGTNPDIQTLIANTKGLINSMLKKVSLSIENKNLIFHTDNKLCNNFFNDEVRKSELNQILEKLGYMGYNIKCLFEKNVDSSLDRAELEERIKSKISNIPIEWEE